MKLDLGCGSNKQLGYMGLDRYVLEGVDVVCDIDDGLPFADNSVTAVMASHVLEHVADFMGTMEEIYRVCKHKAVVCILAPYAHTSLNIANPYHRNFFNEHTPRFLTKSNDTRISIEEYGFPFITQWGLGGTENPELAMDFRCIRMELFYFPAYLKHSEQERRQLRQSRLNVADQIMYHLVAVKEEIARSELDRMANAPLDVPTFVEYRKAYEQTLL